ncbi:MAG: hypothetical protein D3910_05120, partial [Candidatus Electrothrix sp. ATG2]|nr:hypothetical protein [Candidatus Electrothrix sp. ATG2]
MKKQHRSYLLAIQFIAVCSLVTVAHSYDLVLMLPPILAGAQQGTDTTVARSYNLLLMLPPILARAQQGTGTVGQQPLNDTGIIWSGN